MAVGPSLRQLHAHKAIHAGGLSGAEARMEELYALLKTQNIEQAKNVVEELLDYWETRVISHADAEEDGFYQEIVERNPAMQETITKLIRDHDLLKIIVADIRQLLKTEGVTHEVMRKLHSLIVVNEIHSRDEERLLFND